MRTKTKSEELRDLDPGSALYKQIVEKYRVIEEKQNKERAYKHKLVMAILELCRPVKTLSVSKLSLLNVQELTELGKLARELNKSLKNNGLTGL